MEVPTAELQQQQPSSWESPYLTGVAEAGSISPSVSFAALTRNGYAAGSDYPTGLGLGCSASPPAAGVWGATADKPTAILLPGSSAVPYPRGTSRVAGGGFGGDEDEVPPEFRYQGGASGLGDFLVFKNDGDKKKDKKGKKGKKKAPASDQEGFFFFPDKPDGFFQL